MAPKEDEGRGSSHRTHEPEEELTRKEFAILLVRDVAFAGILVAIIFGSMFAYTQVWPPVVVVESGSMQHSHTRAYLGSIDTGDVVLVQAVHSTSDIITYVQGRASGYETYSNYGDVIIFHPPGAPADVTPIIHRAILYADLSASAWGGVDIPSLASFPDPWSATHPDGTPTTNTTGLGNVTLTMRSWASGFERRESLTYDLRILRKSGFLTKGDHNPSFDGPLTYVPPVPVSDIIGKARGELPWFGLIKLTVTPTNGCCRAGWGDPRAPTNSWDSLSTSLVLIPVGIFLADYGFALIERYWKSWRNARESRTDSAEGPEQEDVPGRDSEDRPK